jgi:hypothetical protein
MAQRGEAGEVRLRRFFDAFNFNRAFQPWDNQPWELSKKTWQRDDSNYSIFKLQASSLIPAALE